MDPFEYGLLRTPDEPPRPTVVDVALFAFATVMALVIYLT
jgi:hypothetical protein